MLTVLSLVFAFSAPAADLCPEGHALAKGTKFYAVTFREGFWAKVAGREKTCEIKDNVIQSEPLAIAGCFPAQQNPEYLVLDVPEAWKHECLPANGPSTLTVRASDFTVVNREQQHAAAESAVDCPPVVEAPLPEIFRMDPPAFIPAEATPYAAYSGRAGAIGLILNDVKAAENKLKTAAQTEKYTACLLGMKHEDKQQSSYNKRYRHYMAQAHESFNVPQSLLTCLCGRESRFKNDAKSFTGAQGICQATGPNLIDVEKWRRTVPAVAVAFDSYIQGLGDDLEHKDCATKPLSKELLVRCPSVGIAAAAIYLRYAYSQVVGDMKFNRRDEWSANGLDTLVTLAASYNVGVGFTDKALQHASRQSWGRKLLDSTCGKFGAAKFKEVKGHMLSLRSCMQEDSWLDHQGKPLGGECAMDSLTQQNQLRSLAAYDASLPGSCGRAPAPQAVKAMSASPPAKTVKAPATVDKKAKKSKAKKSKAKKN